MKKIIFLALILSLVTACGQKQLSPKKVVEDGVEVILNQFEPYKIEGEPTTFSLSEVLIIDTEKDELAEAGLTDPKTFDVDSEGNIYILNEGQTESFIFKFDEQGNFKTSFGRKGQGPGEIQVPSGFAIGYQDEILVTDYGNKKLIIFGGTGNLIQETSTDINIWEINPLKNGKYLITKRLIDPEGQYLYQFPILLCDNEYEEIKELDRQKIPNFLNKKGMTLSPYIFMYSISSDRIFIGNSVRGYDIWVYDFDGHLLRKIKKEYKSGDKEEFIKDIKESLPEETSQEEKVKFPSQFPPFKTLFSDDDGRLFVMTSEKGKSSGEYVVDLFNSDGIFVGRTTLKSLFTMLTPGPLVPYIKIKKDRLLCLLRKDSGYKALVVYRMNWE